MSPFSGSSVANTQGALRLTAPAQCKAPSSTAGRRREHAPTAALLARQDLRRDLDYDPSHRNQELIAQREACAYSGSRPPSTCACYVMDHQAVQRTWSYLTVYYTRQRACLRWCACPGRRRRDQTPTGSITPRKARGGVAQSPVVTFYIDSVSQCFLSAQAREHRENRKVDCCEERGSSCLRCCMHSTDLSLPLAQSRKGPSPSVPTCVRGPFHVQGRVAR